MNFSYTLQDELKTAVARALKPAVRKESSQKEPIHEGQGLHLLR